jgi:hypothetical protein
VITGGEPFFLGMADTPEYQRQLAAMRRVFRAEDLPESAQNLNWISVAASRPATGSRRGRHSRCRRAASRKQARA